MPAWNRKAELYVGYFKDGNSVESGYMLEGLDFDFDVTHSVEYYRDTATFNVYNPNDETISNIVNGGGSVIFRAGYEDTGLGNVFIGQIATVYAEVDNSGDRILHIICNTNRGANYPLQKTILSGSFPVGTSYYEILNTIADYADVPLSGAQSLKEIYLEDEDGPYSFSGGIREVVKKFVAEKLRAIGGKVLISNNEMLYVNTDETGETVFNTAYLTYKSGLISAKSERDEKYQSSEDAFRDNSAYYMGQLSKKQAQKVEKEMAKNEIKKSAVTAKNVVSFECLMNPALSVGKPVYIDGRVDSSDHYSPVGRFWVTELRFNGGNFTGSDFKVTGRAEEDTAGAAAALEKAK